MAAVVILGFLEALVKALENTVGKLLAFVLEKLMGIILGALKTILTEILYTLWLNLFQGLLKIISFLVRVFDVMSGLSNIHVSDPGQEQTVDFLQYVLRQSSVSRLLLGMTAVAMVLAFLFAIYETAKSIQDTALLPEARPISRVLSDGLRSMITFALVPFLCVSCLGLSSVLLKEVKISFDAVMEEREAHAAFSDSLFEMAAESGRLVEKSSEKYREFWEEPEPYFNNDLLKKQEVYKLNEIDYFIGILSSLVIAVILLGACLSFVRRLMEVLLLYVVSPFFSATIALDGGKKFAGWRNQFIGAFFGCFGSVFAMRLYLILIPMVTSGRISFSSNPDVNYIAGIFFIIGSAWAIYKSHGMITGLISPEAAQGTGESMGLAAALSFGLGKKLGRGLGRGIGKAFSSPAGEKGGR